MSQVKIYGLRKHLDPIKKQLSDIIHSCVVDALQYPPDKRAHRFFLLDPADFFYPKHNWGFRGLPGDEHQLNYKVEI
jgi:hypothetical protein